MRKRLLGRTNGSPSGRENEGLSTSRGSWKSWRRSSPRRSPRSPSPTHSLHDTHAHAYLPARRQQSQSPTPAPMRARPHHRSLSPSTSRQNRGYDEGDIGRDVGKGREFEAVKTKELTAVTRRDVLRATTDDGGEQKAGQGVEISQRPDGLEEFFAQHKPTSAEAEEKGLEKDTEEDAEVLAEIQKLKESRDSIVAFARERHLQEVFSSSTLFIFSSRLPLRFSSAKTIRPGRCLATHTYVTRTRMHARIHVRLKNKTGECQRRIGRHRRSEALGDG